MTMSRIAGRLASVVAVGLGAAATAADTPPTKDRAATKDAAHSAAPAYLDEMVRESWKAAKLKPSAAASDAEFLRRAYLDVIGRTPNVQEAASFLDAKEPGKRAKLVEYLLASPDYAKNFATIWSINLIGRKDQGRDVDRKELVNWLRRNFAENRPWDGVVSDLITASGSNKENGAVNFALAHMEGDKVPLTSYTTRVFLGEQIQCTQCHDHPSNDWKQSDFWGINAFFRGLKSERVKRVDASGAEVDDHVELRDEPTDAFASFDKRNGLVGIAFPTFLDGRKISQGTDVNRREALAKFIVASDDNQLAKSFVNWMWGHFLGRGFVSPVDDFRPDNPASHPELLDKMAEDFRASKYDVKGLVRVIVASQAYNLTSASSKDNDKDEALFSHVTMKPMSPEQLFDSLLTATAAHKAGALEGTEQRRDNYLRQFIFAFGNDEGSESSGFQGTIPQALLMMNGELMANATGGKSGSFLASVLQQAQQRGRAPEVFITNRIYLAALGRYPTRNEMAQTEHLLANNPDPIGVMEDIFWALLNSNEFVLNH